MIEVITNRAYLSGNTYGRQVWNSIKDKIDWNTQNIIVFPDGLSYMTESFFFGFVSELQEKGLSVKDIIKFKCGNEYIRSLLRIYSEQQTKFRNATK